jgi:hypothetical protein
LFFYQEVDLQELKQHLFSIEEHLQAWKLEHAKGEMELSALHTELAVVDSSWTSYEVSK